MSLAKRVKEEFIAIMKNSADGVSNDELKARFSSEEFKCLPPIINELLGANRMELFKVEGTDRLTYKLRDEAEAERLSELTSEQLLVLQVVQKASNTGVWLRDIKNATNLQQQTLNKALKVLEARKLVKTVKSVQQKTKKLYMAYELEPTREVSGGPWYTDQEFDSGFVDAMQKFIIKFVGEMQPVGIEEIADALGKIGISTVKLELDDVRYVVNSLVFDLKLEEVEAHQRKAATKSMLYKIAKPATELNSLTQMPCGTCPVRDRCTPNGLVSPTNCIYLDKWLTAVPAEQASTALGYERGVFEKNLATWGAAAYVGAAASSVRIGAGRGICDVEPHSRSETTLLFESARDDEHIVLVAVYD
ncbi:hypothetical protein CTAYLR_002788 [Chrysophaeum taylorii]|uniref:DNA-directed RNA polymerase III subunit RPC6 n=1 Tax=Chrysophaeum taylorii TaxID=2483200 RepID=A0AAD7UDN1_9STRA|nr:hypothetical protein CTAYLR_002788 [Chrysophaeum taylorii]